ncbi:MAG TPA: single-stranded-DNA-specific exonuclease RecJ [Stellaceae bacterium]|nr:single-stranded-DNA-specific exonuclease RecJ [Stellaceae bacterium]
MNDVADSFLGVSRSFTGRRWRARGGDDRVALAMAQRLSVPEIVGRVMAARGVALDGAERFLTPTLRETLPDPAIFKDMEKAAQRLAAAIENGETIAIFGDYDVDGATSSALLRRFIAAAGGASVIYIPDRQREGYGPNEAALLRLKQQGASVAVTVDCGITAHAPLAAAARAGLDVIVVDHHVGEPKLPDAVAVVNPNRLDEGGLHTTLAAVGVTFLLAVAVNRVLRQRGRYASRPEPNLLDWLDLVALGTICDVVPLTGVNRALVTQGLKVMRQRRNIGLAALADVAGVEERLDAYHAGFVLGPRVNAGGRVGESELGARLLSSDDPEEARDLARRLDTFNRERRAIEAAVLAEAVAMVDAAQSHGAIVLAAKEGWHPGVIGIVAGRLRERYNRPACVVAIEGGVGKGSGRSVPGLALGPAIIAARQAGLVMSGGGHAMAAGFTVARDGVEALRIFLEAQLRLAPGEPQIPELGIDGMIAPGAASLDLAATVERLGPFGTGNSEPRFAVAHARILHAEPVGAAGDHLRLVLGDGAGGARVRAMLFRATENGLGAALMQARGTALHVAGKLRINRWQGREEIQLLVDDAASV